MLKVHVCVFGFIMALEVLHGAPVANESEAQILRNDYKIDDKGNYKFSFKTSNGIEREESGLILNEGQPNQILFIEGLSTYINPDGKQETFRYIADENGYRIIESDPDLDFKVDTPALVVASLLGK